ncbi:MAG: TonB C-terminal domain-containing protein [Gemmatimonadaceae bacterium]
MARSDAQAEQAVPNGKPLLLAPLTGSVLLHALLIALVFLFRAGPAPPSPPVYRVDLVAAPAGARAAGVVKPAPATPPEPTPPVRPKTAPREMPAPDIKPLKRAASPDATPTPPTQAKPAPTAAPVAGGGETGGRGSDVVTVSTGGIEFPFPGYLENIVRQIALQFKPSSRGALSAEVFFLINRDGSVPPNSIRLVRRSGVYSFDAEAQGAVEAAARSFGPLPSGFSEDALPVTFRFDPRFLK